MNGLSLRVSSVKTNENVRKNAEMRAALIKLPTRYEQSSEPYCMEIKNARTVPDQVSASKRIFETMTDDGKLQDNVLQFLCDLLFSSPLKHPVRNQILKLLITASKNVNETLDDNAIVKALECSIQLMVDTGLDTESVQLNFNIASLSGCFENFECGLKALGHKIAQVFPFICSSVPKYITELMTIASPSVRNEYHLYVHNSIRVLLSCVQEFGGSLKITHMNELRELNACCKKIILDGDIPMDPRTNAGILMAYIAKLYGEYQIFVSYVKDIQNPHEIALCTGVINTCNEHDFELYSSAIEDITLKINLIANDNATVPNILLCATRALYQVSKLTINFALKSPQTLENVQRILETLMAFSVAYMEHHMDSVRHLCRDIVRNVLSGSKKLQYLPLLQSIYDGCNSDNLSLAVKCVVLQQAAYVMGADEIIRNCKTLFSKLFANHLGKDFIVNNLYEALMTANYKEQSFEQWTKTWIIYLLKIASLQDSRLPDIEALIVKAVKCDARVVQAIIFSDDEKAQLPTSTKLSTLWAVRKSGIKFDNYLEIMEKFSENLQLSILSNDNDTRIMALRLLVETHKSTEPLVLMECEHFLTYLKYNSNCQCPATRQKSLGLLTKALARCHVGLQKQMKGKQPSEIVADSPLELRFLQDFIHILVENLFEGANFSRRSVTLQLLQQCLDIAINCDLKLQSLIPKGTVIALYDSLADTYESNKELAVNMLKLLEDNLSEGSLIENFHLEITPTKIKNLLTSVKPTESVTASYQLEFLCYCANPTIFGKFEVPMYAPTMYAALKWLLLELQSGLELAKLNILEAAKLNPLYGSLFAVNHLLGKLDFPKLSEEPNWRILIAELTSRCKELTNVVAPIVNSSSPEGHLPNDLGELPKALAKEQLSVEVENKSPCKILSPKLGAIDMSSVKTTPQMVLLCAWRTVKEVSLILGSIVLHSPIRFSTTTERFLITKEQILEIGEHFKLLLSETKHRGAFEQAYVGFSKLCCRLWTVEAADLNSLPMLWLKDLINLISQEVVSNGKICYTRRSAGVPFMVQALITSELKVGTTKALMFCMTHLLELCSSKDNSSEPRTHGLNILRALFRCTDLNEAVGEHVSGGVMVAINGYDANNWSEKNSATLLFASLITRIFGVQRTKDSENLNIRNKMTGRVFFLRYPKLYDFFLEELQKASDLIKQQQKAHKLHPLLLILSRLYPSALEGTESNLKLSQFIPYISVCGGCPEMQTRYLAAKAIVALINKDEVVNILLTKCAEIVLLADDCQKLKLNLLHGYLLQIFYLLKHHKTNLTEELIADITSTIIEVHQRTALKNAVILKVMLDIYIEILSSFTSLNLKTAVIQQLSHFVTLTDLDNLTFYYTVLYKSHVLYNLHLMRLTMPTEALSDYMLDPPVTHVPLEQAETCLNIILLILFDDKSKESPAVQDFNEMLEEFEVLPAEKQFFKTLGEDTLQELRLELKNSKALYMALRKVIETPKYYPEAAMKAYAILSLLKHFDFTLPQLTKMSKHLSDNVKSPLTLCVERVLQKYGVEYDCAQLCLEYLQDIVQPAQPYCLRLKAASSMSYIAVHYDKSLEMKRLLFIRPFIKLMLDLLMDDDSDIRDYATKLVLCCLPHEGIEIKLYDDKNVPTLKVSPGTEKVVSTVAQRVFLQYTANILQNLEMDDDYILEIFKTIVAQFSAANSPLLDDQNSSNISIDVEIFNKSETNDFAEPLKVVLDAVGIFKNTFQNNSKILEYIHKYIQDLKSRGLMF